MKKNFLLYSFSLLFCLPSVFGQQKNDSASVNLQDVEVNATRNKLYSEIGRILTVMLRVLIFDNVERMAHKPILVSVADRSIRCWFC